MNGADEITADPKLQDEAGRLSALRQYDILDSPNEAAFDRITNLVKTVFNVPICTVSLVDQDRQWFKSCVGLTDTETSRDISFCTHTIQHREPMYIPDTTADARFRDNPLVTGGPMIRSYLGVPLSTPDGYNVGALCAIDVVPTSYSDSQIAILKSFAALVVDEFELRRIAQTDFLTGASTRRSFTLELEKTIARFGRTGRPAALIYLDLDHFKQVNDQHGHPAGDLVLKTVAETLTGRLRQGDTFGRMGGEEFAILLDDTSFDHAQRTAELLRGVVESTTIEHNPRLNVTASFGLVMLENGTTGVREWMAAADEALYDAKRSGRNRVSTGAQPVDSPNALPLLQTP